jgi:hypothetical protein
MGPRLRLPKYVHGFLDRHGVPRFYYRRPGFGAVKLPGLPYSPEFMATYMSAVGGQPLPVGAAKVMPGTMRAVALSYFAAPAFRGLRPSTQREYRGVIERFGAQHIRGGTIHLTQEKTGAALAIPVHPVLAAIIASNSRDNLTFLVTRFGAPFGASAFSHWFRDRCNEAGLPHCSAHGLRKAAARVLAEAGCTPHEIGAITGHSSLAELVRYTKAADQRRLAEAAMAKTRTFARKPAARFAKKGGKAFEIKGQKR